MRRGVRPARAALAAIVALCVVSLSGCSLIQGDEEEPESPAPSSPTSADVSEETQIDSQFTRDGTFQSHISVKGAKDVDFVYTLYPTKATPRTNEWYPKGDKFFSFTFQAYDLSKKLRAPFESKRLVYLDTIKVTSSTITVDGGKTQRPYKLKAVASEVTFDPEPLTTKYGMLITSPKGAFELRNQAIGSVSDDTRGIELTFTAVVNIETEAGSGDYIERKVKQVVPIAIFESDEPTQAAKIPVNAN
ncbi:hypothetical protein GCM10023340_17000 [Nocardioides marinquilinus]|uniref:Uncharacterized protein n=1 Tax=Nocardioides marinquilinus TaxID=1210400 RepID=A0ABP9PGX1_9ACTN